MWQSSRSTNSQESGFLGVHHVYSDWLSFCLRKTSFSGNQDKICAFQISSCGYVHKSFGQATICISTRQVGHFESVCSNLKRSIKEMAIKEFVILWYCIIVNIRYLLCKLTLGSCHKFRIENLCKHCVYLSSCPK